MTGQKPVGPRLTTLMREHDLRAEDIASKLGVSFRTVTRWIEGSHQPTPRAARELGALFSVDWRSFFENPETEAAA